MKGHEATLMKLKRMHVNYLHAFKDEWGNNFMIQLKNLIQMQITLDT